MIKKITFCALFLLNAQSFAQDLNQNPKPAQSNEPIIINSQFTPQLEQPEYTIEQSEIQNNPSGADNRISNPISVQLEVDNLLFWGANLGYRFTNWFQIGFNYHSLAFIKLFYKPKINYDYNLRINRLESTTKVNVKSSLDSNFDYYSFYTRFFPFSNSGFFGQIGLLFRNWKADVDIKVKDYNKYSALIENDLIAKVKINSPKNAIEYRLGWNWVSDSGFSSGLGIGLIQGPEPKVEITSSQTKSGVKIFKDDEISDAAKTINKEIAFTKNVYLFFFNFGKDF